MEIKKIIAVLVILALAYLAGQQLGIIGANTEKIKQIDKKYGISGAKLTPATIDEVRNNFDDLSGIHTANADEENLFDTKRALLNMQEQTLLFIQDTRKINLEAPNCAPGGYAQNAKLHASQALADAKQAIDYKKKIANLKGFEYITGASFDATMKNVVESLSASVQALEGLC